MTDTSPAALRALAEYWASEEPAGVHGDDPDAIDDIVRETDAKMAETVAALRAIAAEKEAGARNWGAETPVYIDDDPPPAPDGWIPWGGGDRPVADDTPVRIRLRNGDELYQFCPAKKFRWRHSQDDPEGDIVAYRLSKEG